MSAVSPPAASASASASASAPLETPVAGNRKVMPAAATGDNTGEVAEHRSGSSRQGGGGAGGSSSNSSGHNSSSQKLSRQSTSTIAMTSIGNASSGSLPPPSQQQQQQQQQQQDHPSTSASMGQTTPHEFSLSRLFGRNKPSQQRGSSNGGGGGGGARRGSAGSRGWDSSNSLNVVLEDSELAVVAAGGGDGDGADEPSSGSALSLHSAGANGAAAAAGVAAGVAGPTNSSLRSLTSEGTGGNDSHGSMSRTGHFSIASLPAMRTSLRNSGLFSPQHRQQPRNAYGRRSSDDGLQGATPTRPRRVTMNMLGSVASAMGSSSRGRGGSSRMVQVSRGTASPAGLVRQIGARSVGGNVRRSTADLTMDGGEGGRHRRAPHVVDLDDFDYVHPRKVDEPALGGNVGIVPTNQPGHTIRVYVAEKIFYSQVRGKTFRIHSNKKADVERVQRRRLAQQPQQQEAQQQEEEQDRRQQQLHEASVGEGGEPAMPPVREISQNPETEEDESSNRAGEASCVASLSVSNYDLVGKTSHARDKLVLRDRDGHTIGVIVRRFVHYDRRYDIYGVQPVSPFQRPAGSQTTKTGEPLYLRARVIGNLKGKLSIDMFSSNNHFQTDVYRIHKLKTGFLEGKTLYITKQEKMAALVKQGAFPRGVQGPAWDGTIAPGIDPCLMLCLIAILDETNRI